jgi:aminoglycoside phosphotransferase (APT) family kinase protein
VLVSSFERGVELDMRAGRQPGKPWEIVGTIAAAIHHLPATALPSIRAHYRDRREHAQASLAAFDDTPSLQADAARTWIFNHLPAPEPCVPVHGDLLGQNILRGLDEPDAVVDWEYAELGDPAYDLAIVTRGARKPFQLAQGLIICSRPMRTRAEGLLTGATCRSTSSHFRPSCIETHSRRRAKPRPNNSSSSLAVFCDGSVHDKPNGPGPRAGAVIELPLWAR